MITGPGRVLRLEIADRVSPCFGGTEFGSTGAYEYLAGRAFCEVDPNHPLNTGIVNLDRAPRNARHMVEYAVDVCLLQPVDPARGNGWLFHEALNRGNKRGIQRLNGASPSNRPCDGEHAGHGFLMRHGYSMAWIAWQGDVLPGDGRMIADFPVPMQPDGTPVVGRCRDETIADAPGSVRDELIADTSASTFTVRLSYPAVSLDASKATLTVRQRERDPRSTPPGLAWRFVNDRQIEITRPPDVDRGAIYEFVFQARDPAVHGLGFAALRDVTSFLRRASRDEAGVDNPMAGRIRHAMMFGISQSGRLIRDFLHQGFNEASAAQPVFDGMLPVIAGSRRMFMNAPFAQTSRYPRQHEDHAYPGDQFPFTYATTSDPLSGATDGILERAQRAGVVPKVMHIDTDSEVWSARASLVVTSPEGADLRLPDPVRAYLLGGLQHGSYKPPSPGVTQLASNPLGYGSFLRALIEAMRGWVEHAKPPPASRFPSIGEGTFVPLPEAKARFPAIPGVTFPDVINIVRLTDHDAEPPAEKGDYPVFAAATNADGNPIAGILHPLIMAPRATYTGWCLRAAGYAEGELYSIAGSTIPFARTRAEREAANDPRPSLEERYADHEGWLRALRVACATLSDEGFLLVEDRERLLAAAAANSDVEGAF